MFENTDSTYQHHQPLFTEKLITDRKVFFIDLKENNRGRFLKITEDVRGRRDTIMLPIEHLDEFIDSLRRVQDFDNDGEVEDRYRDDDDDSDDDDSDDDDGGNDDESDTAQEDSD